MICIHQYGDWKNGPKYLQWTEKVWDPEVKANVWRRSPPSRQVVHASEIRTCAECGRNELRMEED